METAVEDNHKESTENAASESNAEEKRPTPPLPEPPKKSKKEDRLKKDDKVLDQFMKSLNSVPTYEEKFNIVCKKYVQGADENKKLQFYIKQSDKRYALLLKEKEHLQHEFNKTILVKSKLENLCRELQKQNKAIKEESLLKIREEEERRKETQAKFQNTLSEITQLLQQNNEKNAKLRDDNISMSEKFKSVVQQYQLREQQVDKMAKQMALESQLSDAKMQKASLEHQAEKERIIAEMEQLKVSVAQYRAKIMELQGTETALRGQLAVYTDKYDEFQNALVKSNQVFGGFKEQMEKMSKKIKKLEKESLSWKSRWETSQTALLDMCGERQSSEERAAAAARQLHHMQSLCRTLQAERTVLLGTLKEHNIERPALPAPPRAPTPPAPAPSSGAKVDAMAANCAQLRQSLAHLQSQLNVLTNKKENKEEPPKQEKPKKSKSKKNKDKQAQKAAEVVEVPEETKEPIQNEPSPVEDKAPIDVAEEKVDDKTLESLIQAINSANINLCDLEVVNDENGNENVIDDVLDIKINEVAPQTNEVTPQANNVTPQTNDVKPQANDVKPQTNEAKPQTNDVKPQTNDDKPQSNDVKPQTNETKPQTNEAKPEAKGAKMEKVKVEIKELPAEVNSNEVNSKTDLNVSLTEVNPNEEVSHIPEVKPIAVNKA